MNNTVLSLPRTLARHALLQQPFRLFFLGASLFASLGMLLWATFLHLGLLPASSLPPLYWHGHEMLFGFAGALIAGFLLTAVANWTGQPTSSPASLTLLVTVWLVARLGFLLPSHIPFNVAATIDCTFYPLLAIIIARPILRSRNYRNLFVVVLLAAFALGGAAPSEPPGPPSSSALRRAAEAGGRAWVRVLGVKKGPGVLVGTDGQVLTPESLVDGTAALVEMGPSRRSARVVERLTALGLVLLAIDGEGPFPAPPARLGSLTAGGGAARHLSRPDAPRLGLIGAGAQARTQVAAILKVRPIREIVVFSRHLARSQAFADELAASFGVQARAAGEAALAGR